MQYQKEAHKVYSLYYHVIFVVKYRQKVFLEGHDIINDAKEKIVELSESRRFTGLLELKCRETVMG
jgi:REP element-mobilizing transposase RayT